MLAHSRLDPHFTRTIVIVGGGFSGTVLAVNLLRLPANIPTRLLLIERGSRIGEGLAYGARDYPYLLNVTAGRMSAQSIDPDGFLRFAQMHHPGATAEDFLPRALYGRYLATILRAAQRRPARNVSLETIQGTVETVSPVGGGSILEVRLRDGRRYVADDVVAATGCREPELLPAMRAIERHRGLIRNPWKVSSSALQGRRVLVVGTGLTMADIALAAAADQSRPAVITAISPHGLLPHEHRPLQPEVLKADVSPLLFHARSLRQVVDATRLLAGDIENRGGDWRDVVALLREAAPAIWQRLSPENRRRFHRHVQAYWTIHRHRLPSEVAGRLADLRRSGQLTIRAGRIESLEMEGGRIRAQWRPRGTTDILSDTFDVVVNATGPDHRPDPLFAPSEELAGGQLHYLASGPGGNDFEVTSVPELRARAERLAVLLTRTGVTWNYA